jgi:hypothetical protein
MVPALSKYLFLGGFNHAFKLTNYDWPSSLFYQHKVYLHLPKFVSHAENFFAVLLQKVMHGP